MASITQRVCGGVLGHSDERTRLDARPRLEGQVPQEVGGNAVLTYGQKGARQ
jgi:hypothetical protein